VSAGDKAPPKGALEEAVALYDELFHLAHSAIADGPSNERYNQYADKLEDLQRRRVALEPNLRRAKPGRTENLAFDCTACGVSDGEPCRKSCPLRAYIEDHE